MRFLNWLWKWGKRAGLTLLAVVIILYLFVLARSLTPVKVEDDDLYIESLVVSDSAPPKSNAFEVLQDATEKLWWPKEESQNFQTNLLTANNWDEPLAAEVLQKNHSALASLAETEKLPKLLVPSVVLGEDLTYLNDWKNILSLLTVQERSLYESGHVEESFASMFRHLHLCQQMADSHGPLIVYLVGCANSGRVLDCIRQSLATTNLSPAQLKEYIGTLGSMVTNTDEIFQNAIKGEYKSDAQAMDDFSVGKYIDPELGNAYFRPRWWWPVFNLTKTKALFAKFSRELITNAPNHFSDLNVPDINFRPGMIHLVLSGNIAGEVMCYMIMPSTKGAFTTKCNSKVRIEATRTLMALRAYQLTHGKLPDELAALVPEFLDKVPMDDFNGQPLHYSPTEKIVYSVGKNLKDDGGDDRGQEEWNSAERHLDNVFRFDF